MSQKEVELMQGIAEGLGYRKEVCTYIKEKKITLDNISSTHRPPLEMQHDIDQLSKYAKRRKEERLYKVFKDSVHGLITLHPLLVKIVDTPQFQRLRSIKQLGVGYRVYPGASHNRFEHSLGVCHLAKLLVTSLKKKQPELNITDEDVLCVQIAALCHDLGHGPFSHVFDGTFLKDKEKDKEKSKDKCKDNDKGPKPGPGPGPSSGSVSLVHAQDEDWKHENSSCKLFDHMYKTNGLEDIFGKYGIKDEINFIKEMINVPEACKGRDDKKSFLYEIVSNKETGIDVDKFDYFARDCHHLGIQSGFDYQRYIEFARVCKFNGKWRICTRDKEAFNLYELFSIRKSLFKRVYYHKTTCSIELMISDALKLADPVLNLSSSINNMEKYQTLTDDIYNQILFYEGKDSKMIEAKEILERIEKRQLYKFMTKIQISKDGEIDKKVKMAEEDLTQRDPKNFIVKTYKISYGMGNKNPIDQVGFYKPDNPSKAEKIEINKVSPMLPQIFQEEVLRVYYRGDDIETAKKTVDDWQEKYWPDTK
ncbi:deoxynucleoside triphosphate triphosphohydrolase SAMHD1-like isoform X1 [Erpetoichthys calabaricus]|uniref:deoxynucleoside triphosphate triphosphohydrolase SAMHD1-like isoform X1 n=2 Tax=Erpetoichthys calabaricus TaxID=27687 RepID=UPI0010A092C1|nr:deoxynucleoside triphosphate triphosphohydrolase SAMHD1-like isoform X1 [Erpetoichthys calabaricus]